MHHGDESRCAPEKAREGAALRRAWAAAAAALAVFLAVISALGGTAPGRPDDLALMLDALPDTAATSLRQIAAAGSDVERTLAAATAIRAEERLLARLTRTEFAGPAQAELVAAVRELASARAEALAASREAGARAASQALSEAALPAVQRVGRAAARLAAMSRAARDEAEMRRRLALSGVIAFTAGAAVFGLGILVAGTARRRERPASPDHRNAVTLPSPAERDGAGRASRLAAVAIHPFSHLAPYDPITGLPTKRRLAEHLAALRMRSETAAPPRALFQIDLDDFRTLNDGFGRERADMVLRHVAEILRGACGADDMAARCGADEFMLLRAGPAETEEVMRFAESLQMLISDKATIDGQTVQLSACLGVAIDSGEAPGTELMKQAENALAEATRLGPGRLSLYTRDLGKRLRHRRELIDELRAGVARGEIQPWFQPQVEARTGRISGFEALVRWNHPSRGVLAPWQFLELAEKAGLAGAIAAAMREQSFRQLRRWKSEGLPAPRIGLNVTADEMREDRFVDTLAFDADRAGLRPSDVAVELLESAMIERGDDPVIAVLGRLSAAGFRVELDDFGTGHASISNLHRIHVDGIKIDRSFVMKLPERPEQQKLTGAMLSLAAALQIDTLAEGVETEAERALLERMGCGTLQGFAIARPMPAEDATGWIRERPAPAELAPTRRHPPLRA